MALEYAPFDTGTFEGVYGPEDILEFLNAGPILGNVEESIEQAFAGAKSGKFQVSPTYAADNTNSANILRFPLWNVSALRNRPYPAEIVAGVLYEVKAMVYIPSGSPAAGVNGYISLGDINFSQSLDLVSLAGDTILYKELNTASSNFGNELEVAKCSATDQWIEIRWVGRITPYNPAGQFNTFFLELMGRKYGNIGVTNTDAAIIDNGAFYVDNVTIEEVVVDKCGLTIGSPESVIVNDTLSGATGNGKITVFVDKPGSLIEYAIESPLFALTAFQSSNVFSNLRGGYSYSVHVRVDSMCVYIIPLSVARIIAPTPITPTRRVTQLPNRHQRNVQCDLREYKPIFFQGETYANMVNSNELIEGIGDVINDLKLSLLDKRGNIVAEDIATFELYDEDGSGDARLAYTIENFPALQAGNYRMVIYEEQTNKLYLVSNLHEVITNVDKMIKETAFFEYRHSADIYKFGYEELPTFKVRVRLSVNAIDYGYPFDTAEYEEVSTGLSQNPRFDVDSSIELETELYDEKAHRAFATFLSHNSKVINNKVYVIEGGAKYEGDRDKNSYIWNGKITLKEQQFSTINKQ